MTQTSRRGFLRSAGAAALARPMRAAAARGPNGTVRLGFIGAGRVGLSNMTYAAAVPGFEIAALCDVDGPALERAMAHAGRLGFGAARPARDFRDVLAGNSIDAVCISAPDRWRASMTVDACQAGKDVWVEAPACSYIEQGVRMVEAARKYERVAQAGTVLRSSGVFRRAREIVRSGDLGEVSFCRTTAGWSVHPIDLVQWVFDESMPRSISAQGGKFHAGKGESSVPLLATCRYPHFVASYESPAGRNVKFEIVFHGARATLRADRSGYSLFPNASATNPADERRNDASDANAAHWRDFLECIRSRRKPVGDIETCVRSTATCLLSKIANRHALTLDWDERTFTSLKHNYRYSLALEVLS